MLRVRISPGRVHPVYAQFDSETLDLAERILGQYKAHMGEKKGKIRERLGKLEEEGIDYRLVRALATLVERKCLFEAESPADPRKTRMLVFREASRDGVVTLEDRAKVLQRAAETLGLTPEAVEKAMFSDVEDELILKAVDSVKPEVLVRDYNLGLTQTLLFRCLRMEFSASGNWKNIFRAMKRLGLMYSIQLENGTGYLVSVDGPLSLHKMTDRYGTSLAKLLPEILLAGFWRIKAEILDRSKKRIRVFEAESGGLEGLLGDGVVDAKVGREEMYDSRLEASFARRFNSLRSGWRLRREPEPLAAGREALIPDFSFEKHGLRVFLEIVGFWTQEYLERKIRKLNSLSDVDLLIAVDESSAGSKIKLLKGSVVIYFKNEVPLKPILEHLQKREEASIEGDVEMLRGAGITLSKEVVNLEEIAGEYAVTVEAARRALQDLRLKGYERIGDQYVAEGKLGELRAKIESLGAKRYSAVADLIEGMGLRDAHHALESLGYRVTWEGLDPAKGRIEKVE